MYRTVRQVGSLALATALASGVLLMGTTPAGASSKQVSVVGSSTTYQLVHSLFPTSINDLLPGGTTSHQKIASTATYCNGGISFTTPTAFPTGAPTGSTAGKKYLHTEETATTTKRGCVTFAQSTSPPEGSGGSTTVSTHFDYYAYALDGVAPMVGTNANKTTQTHFTAPAAFTLAELRNIYHCASGYTTWKTLNGTAHTGAIVRFWPQAGSGTRLVYANILGFTPAKSATKGSCTSPAITQFSTVTIAGTKKAEPNPESTESGLIYAAKKLGDTVKDGIFIYSAGDFVSQWGNTSRYGATKRNRINGAMTGNFTPSNLEMGRIKERKTTGGTTPSGSPESFVKFATTSSARTHKKVSDTTATTVTEANEWYHTIPSNSDSAKTSVSRVPGVHYVFNVCDTALPGYNNCKSLAGFDNQYVSQPTTKTNGDGTKGRLCAGDDTTVISAQGFVPLSNGTGPSATDNKAGSTCREFPGKSYPSRATSTAYLSWTANTWVVLTSADTVNLTGVLSFTGIATVPVRSTLSVTLTTSGTTTFSGQGSLSDGDDSLSIHATGTYSYGTPYDKVARFQAASGGRLRLTTSTLEGCEMATLPSITFVYTTASGHLATTTPLTGAVAAQNPTSSSSCTSTRKSLLNGEFPGSHLATSYLSGLIT